VVATARDPKATGLQKLAAGEFGAHLSLTQLEVASADSVTAWAEELKGKITHVDVGGGWEAGEQPGQAHSTPGYCA